MKQGARLTLVDLWKQGTYKSPQTAELSDSLSYFSQLPLFILSRLLSSLWVSRTGSASDWCTLQEALYKCIDTIQYFSMEDRPMQGLIQQMRTNSGAGS